MLTRMFKELYEYRDLLTALTWRDIRVKYKQAVMGIMWVFFMPLLAIGSGVVFRLAMAIFSGKSLELAAVVGVMVKSVPWLLFAAIVGGASTSLLSNIGLITKIYFPRQVVPIAGVLSALFDFAISVTGLALMVIAIAFFAPAESSGVVVSWNLLLLPVILFLLLCLATGVGLFLAAANLFFRDVKYIVQVMLQFGLFFSLVFFSYSELGSHGWIFLLNPVAPLLEAIRCVVVEGAIDPFLWPWLGYSTITALLAMLLGGVFFEKAEHLFAEYA